MLNDSLTERAIDSFTGTFCLLMNVKLDAHSELKDGISMRHRARTEYDSLV